MDTKCKAIHRLTPKVFCQVFGLVIKNDQISIRVIQRFRQHGHAHEAGEEFKCSADDIKMIEKELKIKIKFVSSATTNDTQNHVKIKGSVGPGTNIVMGNNNGVGQPTGTGHVLTTFITGNGVEITEIK